MSPNHSSRGAQQRFVLLYFLVSRRRATLFSRERAKQRIFDLRAEKKPTACPSGESKKLRSREEFEREFDEHFNRYLPHLKRGRQAEWKKKNGNRQLGIRRTIGIEKSILPICRHRTNAIPFGSAVGTIWTQSTISHTRK